MANVSLWTDRGKTISRASFSEGAVADRADSAWPAWKAFAESELKDEKWRVVMSAGKSYRAGAVVQERGRKDRVDKPRGAA